MANSVDPGQTAPIGAVCSGSMLFASILNSSVMLGNYLQQTTSAILSTLIKLPFDIKIFVLSIFEWPLKAGEIKMDMLKSDSFTILGLWVLGLAVSHINEFNCKLTSPHHYF